MNQILIRPQELRQASDQLQATAKKIGAALQAIDQEILSFKGDKFLGNRANAVRAHYAPKREALLKAREIVTHFAEDLRNTANIFERADRFFDGRKKIVYLVNGINYDGKNDSLNELKKRLKEQYGDNIEVRIVDAHPYNSNLQKYTKDLKGTDFGGWLSPVDWITNAGAKVAKGATGALNTVYGVGQVAGEYITGGSTESQKVYEWIEKDLRNNGLIDGDNIDLVLAGHSGGGAIIANIVDDIETKLGVNVSGMVTMGSPISNYDHAGKAEKIVDIQNQSDGLGQLAYLGTIRSDEARYIVSSSLLFKLPLVGSLASIITDRFWRNTDSGVTSVTTTDPVAGWGPLGWFDAHGSYWNSQTVVDAIGSVF